MEKEQDGDTITSADVSGTDEHRAVVDVTDFHCTKIVFWSGNAPGKPLHDLTQRNSDKMTSKVTAQDKKMTENPARVCAMGVVGDFEYGEMSTVKKSSLRGLGMPSARAWLVTVRKWCTSFCTFWCPIGWSWLRAGASE